METQGRRQTSTLSAMSIKTHCYILHVKEVHVLNSCLLQCICAQMNVKGHHHPLFSFMMKNIKKDMYLFVLAYGQDLLSNTFRATIHQHHPLLKRKRTSNYQGPVLKSDLGVSLHHKLFLVVFDLIPQQVLYNIQYRNVGLDKHPGRAVPHLSHTNIHEGGYWWP